jgi:hypothetical protein
MHHRTILALLMSTALCAPVAASSLASGSLGNWSITIVDLAPADAAAPSFQFTDEAEAAAQAYSGYGNDGNYQSGAAPMASLLYTAPFSQFTATAGPAGLLAAADIQGHASTPYGQARALWNQYFSLGAWTGLVVTVPFSALATTTVGSDFVSFENAYVEGVLALVTDGDTVMSTKLLWAGAVFGEQGYSGESLSFDGVIQLSYNNASDLSVSGRLMRSVQAGGATPLAPVPEPATWALWAAGLGLMTARARAGKRQS